MPSDFLHATRHLNTLAERVEHWRPGAYAGGLYVAFATAQEALADVEPAFAALGRERLGRLAEAVGVVVAHTEDVAGAAAWRCVGAIKSAADPWHVAQLLRRLFPQPSVQARVTMPAGRTVEVWTAMLDGAGRTLLRRVECALTRDIVVCAVGHCLVVPAKD